MALTETFHDIGASMALPVQHPSGPLQGHWTYEDYLHIPDDGRRFEVMNGVLIMAPSPTDAHQATVLLIAHYLLEHVQFAKLGRVLMAPFDVKLSAKRVVQPDVLVILQANLHRLSKSHMSGAPDLVIEVASPGTAAYDRLSKYDAYEQAGVLEYWLVDADEKNVEVSVLTEGRYKSLGNFKGKDGLPSHVVPTIATVPVEQFFV